MMKSPFPCADNLVHGDVPVRGPIRAADPCRDSGGRRGRPPLLRHASLGCSAGSWSVDRRRHADLLRLQLGHGGAARPRLLQQVPPQLLQVSHVTLMRAECMSIDFVVFIWFPDESNPLNISQLYVSIGTIINIWEKISNRR